MQGTVSALEQKVEGLEEQLRDAQQTKQQLRDTVGTLREENSTLATKNEELTTRLDEQEERLEEQEEALRDQFENLANDLLEEKAETFTEQNEENLDQLLDPLQDKLEAFEDKVEETYQEGLKERSKLEQKIEQLSELNQEMTEQASDLTDALEGQSRTQGEWGEMILERILEESGLQEGREYETQVSETDGQGNRLRPDVVVQLPEDRYIVVDSKVSLTAYRRFASTEDEDERYGEHESSDRPDGPDSGAVGDLIVPLEDDLREDEQRVDRDVARTQREQWADFGLADEPGRRPTQ